MSGEEIKILWNSKAEEVVKEIGNDAMAYKIMHLISSYNSLETYNYLMIFGIILGPISGIVSAIGAALNMSNYSVIVISEIILGFLSGIIVAILKFGKYDELSSANKSAAAKYGSLEGNIRRQLSLYRSNRIDSKTYMDWLETKYDEINASAPLIDRNIFDKYSKKAKENDWKIPNSYSNSITINQEFEDNTTNDMLNGTKIRTIEEEEITPVKQVKIDIPHKKRKETTLKGNKSIKLTRTNTMSKIPEINCCSDQMLAYEMKRLMGFR